MIAIAVLAMQPGVVPSSPGSRAALFSGPSSPVLQRQFAFPRAHVHMILLHDSAFLLTTTETLQSLASIGLDSSATGAEHSELALAALALVPLSYLVFRQPAEDEPRSLDPDSPKAQLSLFAQSAGEIAEARLSSFGWLHADLRTPLPTLEELRTACHLVGEREGHRMFLCASESASGHKVCGASEDFSRYYGEVVFICRGDVV